MLRSVKDSRDPLSTAGVYRIPCACGEVYIGTTQRSVKTRLKEHERHYRLILPDKSGVALDHLETGHKIRFEETRVLCKTPHYYPWIHREIIEIFKHTKTFNKNNLLVVCKACLKTIILRDNVKRKHWYTINNITYRLKCKNWLPFLLRTAYLKIIWIGCTFF